MNTHQQFSEILSKAGHIIITTHQRPDGDAIGSVLGLARSLRQVGKTVTPHTPDPPPPFAQILPDTRALVHGPQDLTPFDLLIALDHSNMERTRLANNLRRHPISTVAIDHHVTAERSADVNIIDPDASATCEILANVLPKINLPIDSGVATCFLLGIVTDTGSFQNANTTARSLETASMLMRRGAHFRAIIQATFGKKNIAALRLVGRALERVQISSETGAAMSIITHDDMKECGANQENLTGVANIIGSIPGASYSLLLTEPEAGMIKGSLRSDSHNNVDVSAIAQRFGGGGHRLAAGFDVPGKLVRIANGWRVE